LTAASGLGNPDEGVYDSKRLTVVSMQAFLASVGNNSWNLRWLGLIVTNFVATKATNEGIGRFFKPVADMPPATLPPLNTPASPILLDTPPDELEVIERPKRKAEDPIVTTSSAKRLKPSPAKAKGGSILAFMKPKLK